MEDLGRAAVPSHSQAADVGEVLVVALRLALVGLVLVPEVAAAGLLAMRASRHISSPSSMKSATRITFSSDWLTPSGSPSTRTFFPNSSRSAGISARAFSRPSLLRAMPQ